MAKVPNTFKPASSIGSAAANLAKVLMAGDDDATALYKRERALGQQRENQGIEAAAGILRGGNIAPGAIGGLMAELLRGGRPANDAAVFNRGILGNDPTASSDTMSRAMLGAGDSAASTPMGHSQSLANARSINDADNRAALERQQFVTNNTMTPVIDPTTQRPVLIPQGQYKGQVPLTEESKVRGGYLGQNFGNVGALPPAEQRILGAEGKSQPTPRNYVSNGQNFITYDGRTDANTGQPLPAGGYLANPQGTAKDVGLGTTAQNNLQGADIARQRFGAMLNFTREIAKKDPTLFGVAGMARNFVQEGAQLANNIALMTGSKSIEEAKQKFAAEAQAQGVSPKIMSMLFDPNLPALESAANLLVYQAAGALAGQEGRGVSDRDVAMFKGIVGNPQSLLASQQSFLAKLQTMEDIVGAMAGADAAVQSRYAGQKAGAPAPVPNAGTTPNPASPAAPAAGARQGQLPDGRTFMFERVD